MERRKAFHFDLDESRLKLFYPSDTVSSYKNAWGKIRGFMTMNDFEHTQYSGYETYHGMSYYDAFTIVENLQDEFPWFLKCAQAATITEIGQRHDVIRHLLQRAGMKTAPKRRAD